MKHFVAYHNREKMQRKAKPFQVYTNKPLKNLENGIVWVIEGIGAPPKEYVLLSWFSVQEVVEPSPDPGFRFAGYGSGHEFREHLRLNYFDWFSAFRRRMGNFGFGLQPIKDPATVERLEGFAKREGHLPE